MFEAVCEKAVGWFTKIGVLPQIERFHFSVSHPKSLDIGLICKGK